MHAKPEMGEIGTRRGGPGLPGPPRPWFAVLILCKKRRIRRSVARTASPASLQ